MKEEIHDSWLSHIPWSSWVRILVPPKKPDGIDESMDGKKMKNNYQVCPFSLIRGPRTPQAQILLR